MSEQVADQLRRASISLASRYAAMTVYGFMAFFIGLLMATTGGVGAIEDQLGPWTRIALGTPLCAAGISLILGSFWADTAPWAWVAAVCGTALFSLWAFTLTGAYIVAGLSDGFVIAAPGETISRTAARGYAIPLFGGLAALQALHLVTLVILRPPRQLD